MGTSSVGAAQAGAAYQVAVAKRGKEHQKVMGEQALKLIDSASQASAPPRSNGKTGQLINTVA